MKKIVSKEYDIYSDKLPLGLDGVKLVMLSDLHDNVYRIDLGRLYDMIVKVNPELVIFAGDLITRSYKSRDVDTMEFLAKLADKYMVCFANGNHETKLNNHRDRFGDAYDLLMADLVRMGIKVLNNDSMDYKKGEDVIHIHGLEIAEDFVKKVHRPKMSREYIADLIGEKQDGFNILVAHNPMFFDNYVEWGAELVFSGHIHGGIIRLPGIGGVVNPDFRLFPKYDAGLFKKDGTTMVLGCGLGTHTINIRINNPPEMVVTTLHSLVIS